MCAQLILCLLLLVPVASSAADDVAQRCVRNEGDSLAACTAAAATTKSPHERSRYLLAKAMLQAKAKEYAVATAVMREAIMLAPRDAQVHLVAAWTLDAAGDREAADHEYLQAAKLGAVQETSVARDEITRKAIRNIVGEGRFDYVAAQGFEGVGQKMAAKAFYLEAAADFERRSDPSVIDAYNAAIRVDPKDGATHYQFAQFWKRNGERNAEVVHQLEEAVRLEPGNADYHFALAQGYIAGGDSAKAVPELHAALQIRPGFAEAKRDLELAIVSTGQVGIEAASTDDTPEALNQLATCIDGDGVRGELACRRALKIGLSAHYAAEAHTFLAQELPSGEAIPEYHAAIAADANYALPYYLLARLLTLPAKPADTPGEDPAPLFIAAAKLRPDWVAPRRELAGWLWSRKQFTEAITEQREAAAVDPDDPLLARGVTQWQAQLAELQNNLKTAAAVVMANPNNAGAHIGFASALAALGRKDEASNEYRAAYKLSPGDGWTIASTILFSGFADVACEIYPNLRAEDTPSLPVSALESDLNTCSQMFPSDTRSLTRLAELQIRSGDYVAAQHSYGEILNRDAGYFEDHPQERVLYDRSKIQERP